MVQLTIDMIVTRSMDIFKSRNLRPGTRHRYIGVVRKLKDFMSENSIEMYDEDVGRLFVKQSIECMTNSDYEIQSQYRTLRILDAYVAGKELPPPTSQIKCSHKFRGSFGIHGKTFVEALQKSDRLSLVTCNCYNSAINRFCERMYLENVTPEGLSREDVVNYVSSLHFKGHSGLVPIKRFLHYLYDIGVVTTNYEDTVHPFIQNRRVILPSVYEEQEIAAIEKAVNRSTPIGKRDYAIVVLASRLGLRASDIAGLKFSNLDWECNKIDLCQSKTGQNIILPLLSIVGNSIIDYIKDGRPATDNKNIFVIHPDGSRALKSGTVSSIISRYIMKAGLDVSRRHHGSHCLRHSLATSMLGNGVPLPVIGSALGHECQDSTMVYLGVNISQLIELSLDVPPVCEDFYNQEGGFFYE